jgi:hypothetical protein
MDRPEKARRTSRARRRIVAATLAVVGLTGFGLASASQLTLTTTSLGAGTAAVGSCQPDAQVITVGFATTFTGGQYVASAVTLSNVAATCAGRAFQLQLTNATGVPVGAQLTGTVALVGTVWTVTIPGGAAASTIGGVSAVIH